MLLVTSVYATQTDSIPSPPLRSDTVEDVVADLENFIPNRMKKDGILGLSIALVRNGKVVWTHGFGVANSITREPVTPNTIFSVASIGKAVSAYTALKFVSEGRLSLDKPLSSYLSKSWLPPTQKHNTIALQHILTHTSGLSNFLRDEKKALKFTPGERFSYSGVGFMYMQNVLEQLTGESFDEISKRTVFQPLGMTSSYFGELSSLPSNLKARGHIAFGRALAPFSIIFIPSFVALCFVVPAAESFDNT